MNISTNTITPKSKLRTNIGNAFIIAALIIMTAGCWNEYSWYEKMAPLGTLISSLALAAAFLCYVDIKEAIHDKELYVIAAGLAAALVNLILADSHLGAFLTVFNLLITLYMTDKVRIERKIMNGVCIYLAFYYFYWTFDVKGYFKGYNTNYGGLVLLTGFVFAVLMLTVLRESFKKKGNKKAYYLMLIPIIFMFAWGYNIIAWYRARCALLGLIVMALLVLLPAKLWKNKAVYAIVTFAMTVGSIIVSILYVFLGRMKETFTIRIFYKDILSGREEIWDELWQEYLKHPITGIGSAYEMKLDWMKGMFEVHNGMLDILIVHGIFVFAVCCVLLIKRLLALREKAAGSEVMKVSMAGIMSILAASFLENFFIVPPFTMCMMLLMIKIGEEETGKSEN